MKTITLKMDNNNLDLMIDLLIEVEEHMRTYGRDDGADEIEDIVLQLMN